MISAEGSRAQRKIGILLAFEVRDVRRGLNAHIYKIRISPHVRAFDAHDLRRWLLARNQT